MTKDDVSIIGKLVKDMYGTTIGNVLGTLTHIDGQIQTVGVDCGSEGLKQIPYEQLVLQGNVVICVPGWRIDAQKILREKRLTLSRLKALMAIISENDAVQSDADIIQDTYKTKLMELDEAESKVRDELSIRLEELDSQEKIIKVMLFDAKVQFKSEEILILHLKPYRNTATTYLNDHRMKELKLIMYKDVLKNYHWKV